MTLYSKLQTSTSANLSTKLAAFAGIALLLVIFFPTLRDIAVICWTDDDYSHGILLPFIAIYLYRRRSSETSPSSSVGRGRYKAVSPFGVALLVAGMCVFLLGHVSDLLYISWVSLFLSVSGFLYLIFGSQPPPFVLPAFWLNFMANPLPDSLTPKLFGPLQTLAAQVSAGLLRALNVPVYLTGNLIEVPGMTLLVEEACSGMRSVMSLLTVALIVLFLVPLSRAGQLLVILSAVFIAMVLNIMRVAATGILAHFYDPKAATGFFHTFTGLVVFIVGLALLYILTSRLERYSWAQAKK